LFLPLSSNHLILYQSIFAFVFPLFDSYQQELPTRFKKEIINEACKTSRLQCENENCIVQEGIQRVLANIGASECLSPKEIRSIFDELGDEHGEIYSKKLMQLL
jgi:hypothetical protein